jgi:hypothetical protein
MTSIGIAGSSFFQRIGGFPKSVQELLDDQQANSKPPILWKNEEPAIPIDVIS